MDKLVERKDDDQDDNRVSTVSSTSSSGLDKVKRMAQAQGGFGMMGMPLGIPFTKPSEARKNEE